MDLEPPSSLNLTAEVALGPISAQGLWAAPRVVDHDQTMLNLEGGVINVPEVSEVQPGVSC